MTKTREFILDADTGQYLDDDGNTVAEVVGDGSIEDVHYIGDEKEVIEFDESGGEEEVSEEEEEEGVGEMYKEVEDGFKCLVCDEVPAETEGGIKSHISQVHKDING